MARTRACKARPRLLSRNTITRVTSGRGSTVESLRASTTSVEDYKDKRGYLRHIGREDSTVKIKQEDEDTTETNDRKISPKRRAGEATPKTSVAKKHKPSPPASVTRLTRSKTLPYRKEASSTRSDSESENDIETYARTKTRSINSPLHLLRPYMAFQLSISGLSGKAYNAAQASMKSVLDVAENFEKQCGGTLARAHDSLSSSSSVDSEERESPNRQKRGEERQVFKVAKLGAKRDDDVLPRKQQELNEQTRKRLAQERKGRERARRDPSEDEDSSAHSFSRSSSTTTSDIATEIASDTDDEAKYPPIKQLSVSSTTSIYDSLRASTTDSGEPSSEGEESDVIERREKNALRRQKARQKKRNAWKREELESESDAETEVDIVEKMEEEKMPVFTESDCGREVTVDFCPIAW
ncbi:uncharacterized protein J4E88_001360 [Alternaria novae-zelandiae]|uniref:uncharacterized protein n=1 Tax=Alternaria novae-zelandiae TaxID=430562 RepID=UPI0020C2858C|nr:uncharacterized protein J4E88_001360 [Alternaria novae-zelandiae]KAI4692989.1 hypothetical protein J4E88_001360 [Alternaria novae-zelandiae]